MGFDRPRLEQIIRTIRTASKKLSLGISVADVKPTAGSSGAGSRRGAYVGRVAGGSIGERLGLRPGDIIVEVNGQSILDVDSLEKAISTLSPGDRLRVAFNRADQWLTAEASL
ncbi:MAG: PDZ domain-containing protein [Chloroflexota bacterium]